MLSKNNFNEKLRQMDNQKDHFAIRKLTIGVASVLIGITFMGFGGQAVHASEVTNTQPAVEQVSKETTTDSTQQNNDAPKDVATAQKTEVATDSQANNQTDNTKESAQLVKPITEADVKATTESQKAEIANKTNEVKPSDTQIQEKQKEQTSEVKTPDTTSNKDEQKSDQTQSLVVDKKAIENTQAATDIAAEKMQNNVQPQVKIQALIARRAESESQFNVDDWDGSLNNTTHEYTLNSYHGTDKENIYIPNTQDFIDAGRISSDDKVYITKKLMYFITINGAVNVTVDDQGEKNKVYAKGDWNHAFSAYRTNLKHVNLSHVDTSGVTNMNSLFLGSNDLQSVDFSGCDLSNVEDLGGLFQNDSQLESVDFGGLDFKNIKNTNNMFFGTNITDINLKDAKNYDKTILSAYVNAKRNSHTKTIDFSDITIPNDLTDLSGLLSNMPDLEEVDLTNVKLPEGADVTNFFMNDHNLKKINFSNIDFNKVKTNNNMFYGNDSLTDMELSNTKNVNEVVLRQYVGAAKRRKAESIDFKGIKLSANMHNISGLLSNLPDLKHADLTDLDLSNVEDLGGLFQNDSQLESVDFGGLDFKNIKNTNNMFFGTNITDINLKDAKNYDKTILSAYVNAKRNSHTKTIDFSDITIPNDLTDLSGLLSNMPDLEEVDLTNVKLPEGADVTNFFMNDHNLKKINFSNIDFNKVKTNNNMFYGNDSLTDMELSNTKNVNEVVLRQYVGAAKRRKAESIDFKGIKLSANMHNISGLLSNLPDLKHADLTDLDLSNVEDLGGLFQNDSQLESVDFGGLDFKNIKNTNNMFFGTNITDINLKDAKNYDKTILSAYVNAKRNSHTKTIDFSDITIPNDLTDLSGLLSNMPDLEEVDLTNVKLPEGADVTNFFMNDHNLKKINFSNIDFNKVKTNNNMFYGNDSLTDMELSNTKNVNEVVLRQYVGAAKRRKAESIDFKGIKLSANMHNISGLLSNLPDLKHADLTDLDLSNVEDLGGLFQNDSQLESVDFGGLDFKNIKNTNNMFFGTNITDINLKDAKNYDKTILSAYVNAKRNSHTKTIDFSDITIPNDLTDLSGLLSNMPDLEEVDLTNVKLPEGADITNFFMNDHKLKKINFGNIDFNKVKTNDNMFYGNDSLTDMELSNTKNVNEVVLRQYVGAAKRRKAESIDFKGIKLSANMHNISGLLSNLPDLKHADLTDLDLSNVEDLGGLFQNDSQLESVDFGGLDFKNIKNTNNMFFGTNITDINLKDAKNYDKTILSAYVNAKRNSHTKTIDFSDITIPNDLTDLSGLLSNMPDLEEVDLTNVKLPEGADITNFFMNDHNLKKINFSNIDFNKVKTNNNMFYGNDSLTKVDLTGTRGVTRPMIDAFVKASQNKGDDTIDLSNIGSLSDHLTDLSGAFSGLKGVKKIDLTNWNTRYVTKMNDMFRNSTDLEEIDGLENWDTSNVTNMSNMFASYTNPTTDDYNPKSLSSTGHLESLNLSKWNTGKVTNMNFMFGGQTYLTSLGDLRYWDTSNVTNMSGLFYDLENIPALDLSNWTTDKVTDMSYMFSNMSKIKNLDSISHWNTHNVVDMSYMFNGMTDLESLDLSNWDPSSVGNNTTAQNYSLARMFSNDINLTTVGDLSKWADKTGNVHDTRWMFYNTPKLENVDLHGWNTGKLQIAEGMFWKSGAKHINIDGWDLSGLKRITDAGYVEGSPNPGDLQIWRGNEHMFQDLVNKSVISMNGVTLPMDVNTAFMVDDFSGDKPIIVIANGKDGKALDDLLKLNTQKWAHQDITGRQNSDFITYVRADDNTKQIGHHGLNFIFTNLNDLHNYFNKVTNRDAVEADMANDPNGRQLVHDWNAQLDVDGNNIVMTARRVSPDSSYDPYSMAIHAVDGKGNMLADLMTSKYQLHIVAPTTTTETKNPTRKIIIENPDGSTRTKKQIVEFTRNVTKHIDGTEEDTPWTPASGNWGHFDVPQHDGYDSYIDGVAGTSIAEQLVNPDTNNVTIHVTYKSNTPNTPEPDKPTPGPDKPTPKPDKPEPETPDVPKTPDEPNEPEKPTVPKKNDKHKKSNKSKNTRPNAEDKAKNKKNSKTHNAGVHGQAAPHAATAPNRLVAPKADQLATGKGLKELNNKPASAAKANANNKETLPQTGEEKDNVGLLGLGLLALAALGFVDRKRRD